MAARRSTPLPPLDSERAEVPVLTYLVIAARIPVIIDQRGHFGNLEFSRVIW